MSVPTEFHSTSSRTYHTLCISVRQPITEVKAEWNVAADVWEIAETGMSYFHFEKTTRLVTIANLLNKKLIGVRALHEAWSKNRINS